MKAVGKRFGLWAGGMATCTALLGFACSSGIAQTDYDKIRSDLQAAQTQLQANEKELTSLGAGGLVTVLHEAGESHLLMPKRLESVIEIDQHEMYFSTPQGEKNPTFRVPAGKTVGVHIHNEGVVMHELMIGRNMKDGEYQEVLTELVPSDVFFYYGDVKSEVGGAKFGELEVEPGLRDVWLRMNIPSEFKGEWELGCLAEGHHEAGMHAKFIVE